MESEINDIGAGGDSYDIRGIGGYYELGAGASLNGDGSITGDVTAKGPSKNGKKYQQFFRSMAGDPVKEKTKKSSDNSNTPKEEKSQRSNDPIGIGWSIDFAFPDWTGIKTSGLGIAVGLIFADDGIGLYFTEKTEDSDNGGFAFSFGPEVFLVHSLIGDGRMNIIEGGGVSTEIGIGIFGGEYGTNDASYYNKMPSYWQASFSLNSFNNVDWRSNTNVLPLVKIEY